MAHPGEYVPGDSNLHRLDPRVKIFSTSFLSIAILQGKPFLLAGITAFFLMLVLMTHVKPVHFMRALKPVLPFISILFFLHLFFTPGMPVPPFPSWRITLTYTGLHTGSLITWQILLLVSFSFTLTMTTSPTELISGIERLMRPLRVIGVPSHDVALLLSIAFRSMHLFLQEMEKIREAQISRGADFSRGSLGKRVKAISSLAIPLILQVLRRAGELASAMEARGYQRGPRTSMRELSLSRRDGAAIAVMILIGGVWLLSP